MMAGDNNIFVYLGGNQEVPAGVTHAVIDPSVKTVRRLAFANREHLVSITFHDCVEIVEEYAFRGCKSLRGIKLLGVREIGEGAFQFCFNLSDVEFGDKLETIGKYAFQYCQSLRSIKMPSVRTVQFEAFGYCRQLMEVEFGSDLERIGIASFYNCPQLHRIAIPLKDNLFPPDQYNQRFSHFDECGNLRTVELVGAGGMHSTISSLLLETWEAEMNEEIDRIKWELPDTSRFDKANAIQQWIRSVIDRMEHYKAEHNRLLKEHMTLLELAIWKAKIEEEEDSGDSTMRVTKIVKIDEDSMRKEKRITSGADIIIKNVLPFLNLA